jgi:hypothetical protein
VSTIPAIYGGLSDEAKAAYQAWNDTLIRRAEHDLECTSCSRGYARCPAGIEASNEEQRVWSEWNALRRLERGNEA